MILLMNPLQTLKQLFLLHNLKLTMLGKTFIRTVNMLKVSLTVFMEQIRPKKFLKQC